MIDGEFPSLDMLLIPPISPKIREADDVGRG